MDEEDLMGDGDEEDWTQTWEDNEGAVEGTVYREFFVWF